MNSNNLKRRQFLQSVAYSGLVYGSGALPHLISSANAMPVPLTNKILVNLNLSGGPDLRHLVVPAFDSSEFSFGNKYWNHRSRSHKLTETGVTAQQRYDNDYVEFVVGDSNWNATGLVDPVGVNAGVRFGIWKEAGWLIDMFSSGNVALVFNAVGGTNRAHDLSSRMLAQGNLLSNLNSGNYSGWGGRLARSAGGNSISLTSSPSNFSFGPLGAAPGYDPSKVDTIDLLSIKDSRNVGLFDFDFEDNQQGNSDDIMARAAKSYYASLRQEGVATAYQKFMDHESKIREFGDLLSARLNGVDVPIPTLINALRNNVDEINPDPNDLANIGRRVLRRTDFGNQIRNLYDLIAANDLVNPSVLSMSYGSWDTHGDQRQVPSVFATDPTNPYENRGIESNLRDIFTGQFGGNPSDSTALHGGFSALYASLSAADRSKMVITIAGEFGRQIRDNGDAGTDHGKGNLMLVVGEGVRGGVYGEIFQDAEIEKYDDTSLNTPDIDPLTEIDEIFAPVCDWVTANSGTAVFPRTHPSYTGDAPDIEMPGMFNNLMI
jgi:hypothetical protein